MTLENSIDIQLKGTDYWEEIKEHTHTSMANKVYEMKQINNHKRNELK